MLKVNIIYLAVMSTRQGTRAISHRNSFIKKYATFYTISFGKIHVLQNIHAFLEIFIGYL